MPIHGLIQLLATPCKKIRVQRITPIILFKSFGFYLECAWVVVLHRHVLTESLANHQSDNLIHEYLADDLFTGMTESAAILAAASHV